MTPESTAAEITYTEGEVRAALDRVAARGAPYTEPRRSGFIAGAVVSVTSRRGDLWDMARDVMIELRRGAV